MSEAGLLSLVQWLSPAFPTGSFAYSHGLEQAIAAGIVTDAPGLADWIGAVIEKGSGAIDGVLVVQAMAEGADIGALAALARALAPSRERLAETEEQGAAFGRTVAALGHAGATGLPLPVAVGRAARPLGLPPERVVAIYLHAFASALVQAGVRFIPLGQTEGQAVLAGLHPLVEKVARGACTAPLDTIRSATIGADLSSMEHETMDVRIFKT